VTDLQVGDRVVLTKSAFDNSLLKKGSTGTVVFFSDGYSQVGVEWDHSMPCGHTCSGHTHTITGHGWWVPVRDVKLLDESPLLLSDQCVEVLL